MVPKRFATLSRLFVSLFVCCCFFQNAKDSLQRSLQWVDSDLLRVSARQEWPAVLHNICMLHSLVRLRTRYGLTGWNKGLDLMNVGTAELWVSMIADYAFQSYLRSLDRVMNGLVLVPLRDRWEVNRKNWCTKRFEGVKLPPPKGYKAKE